MSEFPHLELTNRIDNGLYKTPRAGGGRDRHRNTINNILNRESHGTNLSERVIELENQWSDNISARKAENLPDLPNSDITPIFLQIDTNEFSIDSIKSSFDIEVIAEQEDGYIIGASSSNFGTLKGKIEKFIQEDGKYANTAAKLWEINTGIRWRIEQILSIELQEKWESITDDQLLVVDVGIACYVKIPVQPVRKDDESEEKFLQRLDNWRTKKEVLDNARDEISIERESQFEDFVNAYDGELLSSFINHGDSFGCRISVSGKGLKDIVLNYQFLFEVIESEPVEISEMHESVSEDMDPSLTSPEVGSPSICVIDSGIQEDHKLLSLAIDKDRSVSFLPGDGNTADFVSNGGHGTGVAGCILYPSGIPKTGEYGLQFFIQNARVLNAQNKMPEDLFPPELMKNIVETFNQTRLFNMSINASVSCRLIHMSQWAAEIDKLIHENNILFLLSAGNLSVEGDNNTPGIQKHLKSGKNYPDYLLSASSRISNPAQSSFALTVGSVSPDSFDDGVKKSFAEKNGPSSFSRSGLGIWDMVKPDVVEYGGDFVHEKADHPNISQEPLLALELVRSTLSGGSGVGRDKVGTSYTAPKVAHIAGLLQKTYPEADINLYRALIIQSARIPIDPTEVPTQEHIRHFGYGIPSFERATENSEHRITLIASNRISATQAHVYSVNIPEELRTPGEDMDILIEVTLAYTAKPRRTRRGTKSYLSTWLSWVSSNKNESYEQFAARVIKNQGDETDVNDQNCIPWVIRERTNWSRVPGLKRQDSTAQKSWCAMKSFDLPESINFAVVGHKGWENDLSSEAPYSIAVSIEVLGTNINLYEMIRVENRIELPIETEQRVKIS